MIAQIANRYSADNSLLLFQLRYARCMTTPAERLRIARASRFETIKAAALAIGAHPQNLADHEAGRRKIGADAAELYARRFGVAPEWILYGRTPRESESDATIELPLVGFVSAGIAEVYVDQHETQAPPDVLKIRLGGDRLSAVVRGDSMSPRFMPGERLIFGPPGDPADMVNTEVMAQIDGGPIAVKVLRRGSRPDCWTLASHNPAHLPLEDVRLQWARPFEGMIR